MNFNVRRWQNIWQAAFLIFSTTWLWAPQLNHNLSYRTALISQYEVPGQPYWWLFKSSDIIGALLLVWVTLGLRRRLPSKMSYVFLLTIALGSLADPIFSTSCHFSGGVCHEYFSTTFLLHAIETVATSAAIFGLSVYDYWVRKRLVSAGLIIFQFAYGLLFLSQLASQDHFNTISQYGYQLILTGWLAWYVRENLFDKARPTLRTEFIRQISALWALLNGLLAILVSFAHLRLLGHLKGLYFSYTGAWLAQHSIVTGLVLLYLSRHLLRGERRARQIFVVLMGVETLKYSVITPHPVLLLFYLISTVALYSARDSFDRGTEELSWAVRIRDLAYLLATLVSVSLVALVLLFRNNELSEITTRSIDNFFDYALTNKFVPKRHLESVLLAHTLYAFFLTSLILILWILFRPAKHQSNLTESDLYEAEILLRKYSSSSEDFFKLWPKDKNYFFSTHGFVAYKVNGPVAFALADPIARHKPEQLRLIKDFMGYCRAKGWRVCFLPVYGQSQKLYETSGLTTIQIGASAVIDIKNFLNSTANDKWWRWQKNRATKAGFLYSVAQPPHSSALMTELQRVSAAWLEKGGHKERGFALGYFDEGYLQKCAIHMLSDESGQIVAFTNQLPQMRPGSVSSVDLLRYTPEANNAMPFLLYKTMQHIDETSPQKFFDLGFVPFAASEELPVRIVKALSTGRFSAKGLEQFKNKFDPDWQPNYMAYDGDLVDLALSAINIEGAMSSET